MKKLLLSLIALVAVAFNASAEAYTVGNEDNTSGWWSAFSNTLSLKGNGSISFSFTNYSSQTNNWNNWLAVCTSDADRNDTANGYTEYFVMRADNYGWGAFGNTFDNPTAGTLASNYNWDTFKADMDGATVNITLIRLGNTLKLRALTTTAAETPVYYYETWEQTVDNLPETIRFFLTTELGHLNITSEAVNTPTGVYQGTVGKYSDSQYSSYSFPIPETKGVYTEIYDDGAYIYDFCGVTGYDLKISKTDGTVTSLNQCVYGVERSRTSYGYSYVLTGLASPSVEDMGFYPGWDNTISVTDETSGYILLGAYMYVGNNSSWDYYYLGWGDSTPSGIASVASDAKANATAPAYNLAGQRVAKNAKGLVITNGKKLFNK